MSNLTININAAVSYDKEQKSFSAYSSDLQKGSGEHIITLVNPKTSGSKIFFLTSVDRDASGEDIYGWNYKSNDGYKLLIIND